MKKKESKDPLVKKIINLRDALNSTPEEKEAANVACKGMYKCSKLADSSCLEAIISKLEKMHNAKTDKVKKTGGRSKSKTRSRSRSKSRKK